MLNFDLADTVAGQDLIQMGKIEEAREMLLVALEAKFEQVSELTVIKINQINDIVIFQRLLRLAIKADNLDKFQENLEEALTQKTKW
jgi:hypothetical protein